MRRRLHGNELRLALACAAIVAGAASLFAVQGGAGNAGAANSLSPADAAAGWVLLFDGRTLTGWTPATGDADWKVDGDTITFTKGRGLLRTEKSFANYELKVDFWGEKTANSGVFLRCGAQPSQKTCYEVNIFDAHPTDPTGSIVGVHSLLPDRPDTAEKWTTLGMTADGSHLVIKLNDKVVTDVRDTVLNLVSGPIGLQAAGPGGPGVIKFRNIRLRPL